MLSFSWCGTAVGMRPVGPWRWPFRDAWSPLAPESANRRWTAVPDTVRTTNGPPPSQSASQRPKVRRLALPRAACRQPRAACHVPRPRSSAALSAHPTEGQRAHQHDRGPEPNRHVQPRPAEIADSGSSGPPRTPGRPSPAPSGRRGGSPARAGSRAGADATTSAGRGSGAPARSVDRSSANRGIAW